MFWTSLQGRSRSQFIGTVWVHSLSYKLSVEGVLLWQNLIGGGGNRWATTSPNAWATLFNSLLNVRNSAKMSTFGDLQKKREKQKKTLSLFFLFYVNFVHLLNFIFVFYIYFVCRSQFQSCRSLHRLPKIISGAQNVPWITGHCWCHITIRYQVHIRWIVEVIDETCGSAY